MKQVSSETRTLSNGVATMLSRWRRVRPEFRGAGKDAGFLITKLDQMNGSFKKLGDWRPRLTPPFVALIPIIAGVLGLINPLVAGFGAVGAAAIGFGASLGSVAGSALAAVPALGTLLSIVFALKAAFSGIGGAFSSFGKMKNAGGGGGGGGPTKEELTYQEELQRAQEKYRRAIEDVHWAQEDLDEARKGYLKRLKDLRQEVDRIAISEARAAANAQLAREDYANVLADPGSTKGQKMAAKAALEEAQNDLRDLREENKKLREDLAEMEKKGMSGDRSVIQAQRRLTDALWAQRDAQLALINAQNGANKASGGGASAANAYQDALNKLSPSARRFVETIVAMDEAWTKLKKNVQERFFSQFVDDVDRIRFLFGPLESLLGDAAEELGKFARNFIMLVTSPAWREDIILFGKGNIPIIRDLGSGVLFLLDGIRNLAMAAQPALQRLVAGFERGSEALSGMIASAREDGSLAAFLDRSVDSLAQWWRIIKNIGKTLFNYGKAAGDFTQWLMGGFEKTTEGWLKSSEEALGPNSTFRKYLEDVKPLISEIKGLFGDFFRWFAREAADEKNIGQMTEIIKHLREDLGPALGKLLDQLADAEIGPKFIDAISKLVEIITALTDSSAVETFFTVLNFLLEVLKWVVSIPGVGSLLGAIASGFAAIAAVSLVGKFTGITKLIKWLLKLSTGGKNLPSLLGKIMGALGMGGLVGGSTRGKHNANAPAVATTARTAKHAAGGGGLLSKLGGGLKSLGGAAKGSGVLMGAAALLGMAGDTLPVLEKGLDGTYNNDPRQGRIDQNKNSMKWVMPGVGLIADTSDSLLGTDINGWMEDVSTSIVDKVDEFFSGIGNFFTDAATGISDWWQTQVVPFWTGIAKAVGDWWNEHVVVPFTEAATNVSNWWQTEVVEPFQRLSATIGELWDLWVIQPFALAIEWVKEQWNTYVVTPFLLAVEWVKAQWNTYVVTPFSLAIAWVKAQWTTYVATPFSQAVAWVKAQWNAYVTTPFNNAVEWVKSQWNAYVTSPFNNAVSAIQNAWKTYVTDPFSSAITSIKDAWESFWSSFSNFNLIDAINSALRGITGLGPQGGKGQGKGKGRGSYHGGPVLRRANGGGVPGVRSNSDTVRAMLTPGEYVVRKAIVDRVGIENLEKFNAGVMSYAEMLQTAMRNANDGGQSKNVGGGTEGVSFFNGGGLVPDLPGGFSGFGGSTPPPSDFGGGSAGGGGSAPVIGGDLVINNPAPEPASDSLPRSIRKVAYLGGGR